METTRFKRLNIRGWRQFDDIDIELHPRLTIITGANGAGKSTILTIFNRHFGYNRNYIALPRTSRGITSFSVGLFSIIGRALGVFNPNRNLQAPLLLDNEIGELEYDNGTKTQIIVPENPQLHYQLKFPSQQSIAGLHIDSHRPPNVYRHVENFPSKAPDAKEVGQSLNNEYVNYYSNGAIQFGSLHHIKIALIQMSIFGHGNETMEPIPRLTELFKGFEAKLKLILPKSLGFNRLIIRSPEVILSTESGDFLLDAASGGIIKLFEIAWQIYFYSQGKESFVVTMDEPENHLHPSMQKAFLPNILETFPDIQLIVVTHSPFIISAMRDSSVYVLRYVESEFVERGADDDQSIQGLMGSRVVAEKLDTVNKAGSASEILRDVLGITATIPDWAGERVGEIVDQYRGKDLNEVSLKAMYSQLESEGLASSYPHALSEITRTA